MWICKYFYISPQIQAASERLQELREKELRKSVTASPNQSGSGITSGFPSANKEILDAQRKRFEELKVCVLFRCMDLNLISEKDLEG